MPSVRGSALGGPAERQRGQDDDGIPVAKGNGNGQRLSAEGGARPPYSQPPSSADGSDAQSVDDDAEIERQLLSEDWEQEDEQAGDPCIRRSKRTRKSPQRFEGAFAAALEEIKNPRSYNEALEDRIHGVDWQQAVDEELAQLQALDTWEVADLPPGKRTVGCRWVFAVKLTSTGLVDRFKARLVAQGFSQVPGDDYLETFAPTIRGESLRILLAIAAYYDLEIRQIDVVSAYPRSVLHAVVYMRPPQGLKCAKGKVLRLKKSLYGLKQSGREWYIEACEGLKGLKLYPLFSEPSIFATPDRTLVVGLYVDDMLIMGKDSKVIDAAVVHIKKRWAIKDLGEAHRILGLRIVRDRKRKLLSLDQLPYIEQMLVRFDLEKAKPFTTPASDRNSLTKGSAEEQQADQNLYQQGVGTVNWLSINTRPDISYCCGMLAQHCSAPTVRNWNGVIHLMRYFSGTRNLRLWFGGMGNMEGMEVPRQLQGIGGNIDPRLLGFCDADYAGDETDRKSVTGHLFLLNRGPVTWSSTKQRCVAMSTAEAEYIALSEVRS